jgi:hypothetical protein
MQIVPRERDVLMVFVPRCVIQTRIVFREKFALTAPANLAVTKKRIVALARSAKEAHVFAQLASSTPQLAVKT